jgi:hypothetical protein
MSKNQIITDFVGGNDGRHPLSSGSKIIYFITKNVDAPVEI